MEKFLQYLQDAEKTIRAIDHLLYITYPIVNDKRILLKIIIEAKAAMINCINAILQYEYLQKRIKIHKSSDKNLETFIKECAPRYNISSQEISIILELFQFADAHKKSTMEFVREEKVVIMSEKLKYQSINLEKIKNIITTSKSILVKTKKTFRA